MYVGRIVAIGKTPAGKSTAMYRVSSRSFPNREARLKNETVSIMPRKGFEDDLNKNPYIAYNCIRLAGNFAIATNGSHTDPITEKILSGMNVRDALAFSMLALDYEKDSFNTPRISAVVERNSDLGWLGIVKKGSIHVTEFKLEPGILYYVATYEHTVPCSHYADAKFNAVSAESACDYVIGKGVFAELENPVTSAAAVESDKGYELAVKTLK
jgi:IMP cyclohydrolase